MSTAAQPHWQRAVSWFLAFLVIALALAYYTPASAQDAQSEACDVNVTALQLWYMAIDPENVIALEFITAISNTSRVTDKFAALEAIQERLDEIADMEHPACMQQAVDWYIEGVGVFITALESFIDGDVTTFVSQQSEAMQLIGQFRGYVAAYGVELYETDTATIYLK